LRQAYDYWQNQPDCYLTLEGQVETYHSRTAPLFPYM